MFLYVNSRNCLFQRGLTLFLLRRHLSWHYMCQRRNCGRRQSGAASDIKFSLDMHLLWKSHNLDKRKNMEIIKKPEKYWLFWQYSITITRKYENYQKYWKARRNIENMEKIKTRKYINSMKQYQKWETNWKYYHNAKIWKIWIGGPLLLLLLQLLTETVNSRKKRSWAPFLQLAVHVKLSTKFLILQCQSRGYTERNGGKVYFSIKNFRNSVELLIKIPSH